jgi:DNA gyrase subunit B
MPPQNQQNPNFNIANITGRITPREHVRIRPGMYIGGIDKRGLHHLVWEVLDSSIEEAMLGNCSKICIQLLPNHEICVEDNSLGLPVHLHPDLKKVFAEYIMTSFGYKPSFDGFYYTIRGGLHGVGLTVVNALSSFCQVEIKRDGFLWRQSYSEGLATSPFEQIRLLEKDEATGNQVRFRPDFSILDENDFDFDFIAHRCQELAFLYPKLEISVEDKRDTEREVIYWYPNGLLDWLMMQTDDEISVHFPLFIHSQTEMESEQVGRYKVGLDLAFQYIEASYTIERSFINSVPIPEGGSHLEGLKTSLIKVLSTDALALDNVAVTRGLVVAINLRHPDPQFVSPTKVTLLNSDVEALIERTVEALFAANPEAKAAIQEYFNRS